MGPGGAGIDKGIRNPATGGRYPEPLTPDMLEDTSSLFHTLKNMLVGYHMKEGYVTCLYVSRRDRGVAEYHYYALHSNALQNLPCLIPTFLEDLT